MVRADRGAPGVMFSIDTETGFPGVGAHQRRLGPRRDRRAGHGRSRRVPGLQAVARRPALGRSSTRRAAARRASWSTRGRRADARQSSRPRAARAAAFVLDRRRDPAARPLGCQRSSGTTAGRWTWNGPRTGDRRALHRAGAPGNGAVAHERRRAARPTARAEGRSLLTGSPSARRSPPARCAPHPQRERHRALPGRRGAGHRHDRPGLGADHETGGRASSPTTADARATPPSSAASSACRRWSAPATRPRCCTMGRTSPCPAPRATRASSTTGALRFEASRTTSPTFRRRAPQMMLNMASPAAAFRWWRLPADGVGLARMEFIISNADQDPPDGAGPLRRARGRGAAADRAS